MDDFMATQRPSEFSDFPTKPNTLIINCLAGPGAGKSTMSGGLFNKLKTADYNVEYVQEFAKTLTWEGNHAALSNQFYVSGVQNYTQNMLVGQVDAVITDSPIILGLLYYKELNVRIASSFYMFMIETFKAQNNINFFIKRTKKYNPAGRNQTEDESKVIDNKIMTLLDSNKIPYTIVNGNEAGMIEAYEAVTKKLGESK